MRIRTVTLAIAAVAALTLVPAAEAGGGKAKTTVVATFEPSSQPNPHNYKGHLESTKGKCIKNRDVRLRVTGGSTISESKTNSAGKFTLQEDNPSGFGSRTIYALPKDGCKVGKFTLNGGG